MGVKTWKTHSDRGLASRIYKELSQFNNKKMAKDYKKQFTKDIQMANKRT